MGKVNLFYKLFSFFLFFTILFDVYAVPKSKRSNTQTKKGIDLVSEEEIKVWKSSKRVALIVGINGYESLSRLTFATGDSLKMKLVLEQVGKFDEIVLLNDQVGKDNLKYYPTKKNIEREFNRLVGGHPNMFLFYYSGHGFMNQDGENIIAPIDIVYKSKNEIRNTIKISTLVKKSKKLPQSIFFLDACREELKEGRKALQGEQFGNLPEEVIHARGIGIMMGTKPGGYSYENKELGSGLFTHFLVEGISGGVQNEGPEYVTFRSLKSYVEEKIQEYVTLHNKEEQIPFTAGDYSGNFLIAVGRPKGKIRSDLVTYKNFNKNDVYSRILYDTKNRRISQNFFIYGDGKKYIPSDLDGISKMNFEYGTNEFIAKEYNLQGEPVFNYGFQFKKGTGVIISFLEDGVYKVISYIKNKFTITKTDKNGRKSLILKEVSYKKRGKNLIQTEEYKNQKGEPKANELGFAKVVYLYRPDGKVLRTEYLGMDGKPANDRTGVAKYINKYDKKGNLILEEFRDSKGSLKEDKYGIAKYVYQYNNMGKLDWEEYYNSRGMLYGKSGIAKIIYQYDTKGNLIQEEYLDNKLELKDNGSGLAKIRYTYIEGKKIEEYFGEDDKPVRIGIAKKVYTYNNNGDILNEQYYNSDKNLVEDVYYGMAEIVYTYNNTGQKIKETYYDSNNKLKENVFGIAQKIYEYDKNGKIKQVNNIGNNGQLKGDTSGVAYTKYLYDAKGRKIEESYFDLLGNSKENGLGIAKQIFSYGVRDIPLIIEKRNSVGRLQNDDFGVAIYNNQYDNMGRKIMEELYNSNKVLIHSEYHKYFSNPYKGKKDGIVHLKLDKYYRPIGCEFLEK
ncbi:MAG: caspase family protein [Leptospiraceae bacterium]|nr:caspase family protein [Leptospiraceae bacterium]MCP5494199.1 caspase family protein [Leptospiraceae bacterium]